MLNKNLFMDNIIHISIIIWVYSNQFKLYNSTTLKNELIFKASSKIE